MSRKRPCVLVVDRERADAKRLVAFLRERNFDVVLCGDAESAFNVMDGRRVDCLVTALRGSRIDGLRVLHRARELNPDLCGVVLAEGGEVEMALEAMHQGAYDFQVGPVNTEKLLAVLQRGLAHQALVARLADVEGQLDERVGFDRLAGRSRAIQRVMDQVRQIAPTRATVLLEGESGTGKRLVAQAIHRHSPRKREPFVSVNCAAFPADVIEGELFGHQSGTGSEAVVRRGSLELADTGTLYLDQVGEAPPGVQVRLLRVLQDRAFERVGGKESLSTDARLIAATHGDLLAEVKSGRFREDLFHRLSVARVAIPPLRERPEDIPLLVEKFIRDLGRRHGRKASGITRGALERLLRHSWPGNVRELENTIEGMVAFAEGRRPLDLSDLPEPMRAPEGETGSVEVDLGMTVEEAEHALIAATLRHTGNDKPRAAAMLGIGLRTLYRKIKRYAIR